MDQNRELNIKKCTSKIFVDTNNYLTKKIRHKCCV